ncbi:hypothetical protein F-S17_0480 [Faustovirus]|nr:hypothetical protein F-S17_0480 [Faustovirus]
MRCDNRVCAGVMGGIAAIFIAGVITCFVLLVNLRAETPEHLCYMIPGECYDTLRDGSVTATYQVNVTIAECPNWEVVEMWVDIGNCQSIESGKKYELELTNGQGTWGTGGVACRPRVDDPNACAWDRGAFVVYVDNPLMAAGIVCGIGTAVFTVMMSIYLCCLCCRTQSRLA